MGRAATARPAPRVRPAPRGRAVPRGRAAASGGAAPATSPRPARPVRRPAPKRSTRRPARKPGIRASVAALPVLRSPFARTARAGGTRALDALLSGQGWIALVFVLLAGIVFFNVDLLQRGRSIAVGTEKAADLRRANASLRLQLAALGSSERIQREAAKAGFVLPAPGDVLYRRTSARDARRALKLITAPSLAPVIPPPAPAEIVEEPLVDPATDPAATDPAATDPSLTDPATTDPTATDPAAVTDPAATAPTTGVAPPPVAVGQTGAAAAPAAG